MEVVSLRLPETFSAGQGRGVGTAISLCGGLFARGDTGFLAQLLHTCEKGRGIAGLMYPLLFGHLFQQTLSAQHSNKKPRGV